MEAATLVRRREARARKRGLGRRLLRISSFALAIALVVLWIIALRPVSMGGPAAYVIVAGHSMEPTLRTGDLVIALEQSSYAVGDVVVYRIPEGEPGAGTQVIHRIVGGSRATGFVVKGDGKEGIDPWRPKAEDVVGKLRLLAPRAGWALLFLRTPPGLGLVAGLTTLLVFLALTGGAQKPQRRRPPRRSASPRSDHGVATVEHARERISAQPWQDRAPSFWDS
jgi:signal peptidase